MLKKPAVVLKKPAVVLKKPAALKKPAVVLKKPAVVLGKQAVVVPQQTLGTALAWGQSLQQIGEHDPNTAFLASQSTVGDAVVDSQTTDYYPDRAPPGDISSEGEMGRNTSSDSYVWSSSSSDCMVY